MITIEYWLIKVFNNKWNIILVTFPGKTSLSVISL